MNNSFYNSLLSTGVQVAASKRIIICGIVRDCGRNLKRNIPYIEKIANHFADYQIVVLENNSRDDTKEVLIEWMESNQHVKASINEFDESMYRKLPHNDCYSTIWQLDKMQKYYDYRNLLFLQVEKLNFYHDYIMMIDMDVAHIDVNGVITSFGVEQDWDAITANGYSFSNRFERLYYDTFALCEKGEEENKQTAEKIYAKQKIYSFLRKGMPLFPVFSAYGGIAIFQSSSLEWEGEKYVVEFNNFDKIQVRCEHFALFKAMAQHGYGKVFINPNMQVKYQEISLWNLLKAVVQKLNQLLERGRFVRNCKFN